MKNINGAIDHTILSPTTNTNDIKTLCEEANTYGFSAVCVPPIYVEVAKKLVAESVNVCTVIGYPLGYDESITKIEAIKKAVESGADELDVVVNISKIKDNDWHYVENEIDQLVTIAKNKYNKVIKLIFETAYLDSTEIEHLCKLCNQYGVDYAKTSTGMASKGAEVETVALMRKFLDPKVKIKASGGIRTLEQAKEMIAAGANRIGASRSVDIVGGLK